MRQTVLYIAMSLDGYIADRNGGVEWLTGQDGGVDAGDSYTEFTKEIDTVVMGWNTYHQVTTELAPGEWVYEEFTSYIFTHREPDSTEKIRCETAAGERGELCYNGISELIYEKR